MKQFVIHSIEDKMGRVEALRQEFPIHVNTLDRLLSTLESSVAGMSLPKNQDALILDSAITIAAIHALKILLRNGDVTFEKVMELIDADFAGFKTYAQQRIDSLEKGSVRN